jgi:hypothetical protein
VCEALIWTKSKTLCVPSFDPDAFELVRQSVCSAQCGTSCFRFETRGHYFVPCTGTPAAAAKLSSLSDNREEDIMGFGRGALLWLLGVPLPIILLLALFWR